MPDKIRGKPLRGEALRGRPQQGKPLKLNLQAWLSIVFLV